MSPQLLGMGSLVPIQHGIVKWLIYGIVAYVEKPCLFHIENDPTEHEDVSQLYPKLTASMLELFYSYDDDYHSRKKAPNDDKQGYCDAVYEHEGFCAPWIVNSTWSKT